MFITFFKLLFNLTIFIKKWTISKKILRFVKSNIFYQKLIKFFIENCKIFHWFLEAMLNFEVHFSNCILYKKSLKKNLFLNLKFSFTWFSRFFVLREYLSSISRTTFFKCLRGFKVDFSISLSCFKLFSTSWGIFEPNFLADNKSSWIDIISNPNVSVISQMVPEAKKNLRKKRLFSLYYTGNNDVKFGAKV